MMTIFAIPGGKDYQRADITVRLESIYTDSQAHQTVPKAGSLPGGQTKILKVASIEPSY